MDIDNKIEALKKELEALEAERNHVPVRKNELGFYAVKSCKSAIENIQLIMNGINFEQNTELELTTAFNQINKMSWNAIKSIERDATERNSH